MCGYVNRCCRGGHAVKIPLKWCNTHARNCWIVGPLRCWHINQRRFWGRCSSRVHIRKASFWEFNSCVLWDTRKYDCDSEYRRPREVLHGCFTANEDTTVCFDSVGLPVVGHDSGCDFVRATVVTRDNFGGCGSAIAGTVNQIWHGSRHGSTFGTCDSCIAACRTFRAIPLQVSGFFAQQTLHWF